MRTAVINREMQLLGLSPRHKGFYFLGKIVSAMDGIPDDKLRETYSSVCAGFEHGRRISDKCMYYAVGYAWDIANGRIHELFPGRSDVPSPMELAVALHWELEKRN